MSIYPRMQLRGSKDCHVRNIMYWNGKIDWLKVPWRKYHIRSFPSHSSTLFGEWIFADCTIVLNISTHKHICLIQSNNNIWTHQWIELASILLLSSVHIGEQIPVYSSDDVQWALVLVPVSYPVDHVHKAPNKQHGH